MNYLQVMKALDGYTIQKGDTLGSLAKRFGTTVSALAGANNISDVNKIYAGRTLYVPKNASSAESSQTNTGKWDKLPNGDWAYTDANNNIYYNDGTVVSSNGKKSTYDPNTLFGGNGSDGKLTSADAVAYNFPMPNNKSNYDPIYYGGTLPEVTVVPNYPINEREISNGFVAALVGNPRTWTFNKDGVTYYPTGVKVSTVNGVTTESPYYMDDLGNIAPRDIDVYGFGKVPFRKSNLSAEVSAPSIELPNRVINYALTVPDKKPRWIARVQERRNNRQKQA